MTVKFVTWRPDTCDCVINEKWDDADPDLPKSHVSPEDALAARPDLIGKLNGTVFAKATGVPFVEVACPAHSGFSGPGLYDLVLKENTFKNQIPSVLVQVDPTYTSAKFRWSWKGKGDSRSLVVEAGDVLPAPKKAALQTLLDTAFGAGKVAVA